MTRYECDKCGACCRELIIEVFEIDLLREPKLKEHVELYRPDGIGLDGEIGLLACGHRRPCPLLGTDNHCTIYPSRPTDCVLMEAGDEQCQQARQMAGLPPLEPVPD